MSVFSGPCVVCKKTANARCNGCKKVYFCNRVCQKINWKSDSACECKKSAGPLFKKDEMEGNIKYKTHDNDCCFGMKCPDFSTLELLNGSDYAAPTKDQIMIVVFWAQYHKPGYKFLPFYTQLQEKYGKKVCVVGVSTDPTKDYPEKFLEDPKKKYAKSPLFPTRFLIAHDVGAKWKDAFSMGIRDTLNLPHSFVVQNGTVVWHQDHSELGATAPTYMNLFESQLQLLLAGKKLASVGSKEESDDEDSEDEGDEGEGPDLGSFF